MSATPARTRIRFDGLKVYVLAVDGQPTDTFEPLRATLPFPPGTRYDLMLDMPTEAGAERRDHGADRQRHWRSPPSPPRASR